MRLSRAVRIRRTAHSSGGGGAQGEGSSASLPSTAWHGGSMFRRIAPTLPKNVILAFPYTFLIIINRYLARLNTF